MRTMSLGLMALLGQAALLAQPGQSEFRPATEVPASEQLPSAPLVMAAYALVWLAFLVYVWLTWRKLGAVEQDLRALSARVARTSRTEST
jgi:hypothetical protein